jgi:hypothetical protein
MRPGRSRSSSVSWNGSSGTFSSCAISPMSAFSFRIAGSASGQPLFQGSTSASATRRPSSLPLRTIARRFTAAVSTSRPCAMSLIPPCTIRTSAPRAHSSSRAAISSVRWP